MDTLEILEVLADHDVNRGFETVSMEYLPKFVRGVQEAGLTREELVAQLEVFYQAVHDRVYHDLDLEKPGIAPFMVELVNAYEQARTNT